MTQPPAKLHGCRFLLLAGSSLCEQNLGGLIQMWIIIGDRGIDRDGNLL
jgi:hypothetical protein